MVAEGEVHRGGKAQAIREVREPSRARGHEFERDYLFGIGIGKWLAQNAIEHTKDRGVGADADGQREQYGEGKTRGMAQPAKYHLQVVAEGSKRSLPHLAAALFEQRFISKSPA